MRPVRWGVAGRFEGGEVDGEGGEAAAAADGVGVVFVPVEDGVVGAEADGAVVGEDEVGDAREGFEGFLVGVADGGARGVAAGHDEEFWHLVVEAVGVVEEEHVEGGVGEEKAEFGGVRGDAGGDAEAREGGLGAREGRFRARGRQGGPAGFHGRFLNGILAGPPCRRVGTVVVAERSCFFGAVVVAGAGGCRRVGTVFVAERGRAVLGGGGFFL